MTMARKLTQTLSLPVAQASGRRRIKRSEGVIRVERSLCVRIASATLSLSYSQVLPQMTSHSFKFD